MALRLAAAALLVAAALAGPASLRFKKAEPVRGADPLGVNVKAKDPLGVNAETQSAIDKYNQGASPGP